MKSAIPVLEQADKAFSGAVARDSIMTAQTGFFFQMGLQNPDLAKAGMAMQAGILNSFKSNMFDVVSKYQAGTANFPQALKQWQTFTREHYRNMFTAGTKAAGNPYYAKLGLTQKDLAFIDKAVRYESRFFKKLLFDMKDPKHLPANQIPRDAAGRMLKGYRVQKFGYLNRIGNMPSRAEMYAESGQAQFYNGMVAGSSQHLDIYWVLGVPMLDHCDDCPILARRKWIWKTLPTVPRAGDTACKHRCYCRLEFRPKKTGPKINIPGRATAEAISTLGRHARVFDAQGVEMTGVLQQEVEAIYAKMYKARQMMRVTKGAARMEWIQMRKALNRQLIDRLKVGNYRAVPTISVNNLLSTIDDARNFAMMKGGSGNTILISDLFAGDELVFTRGDFSARGVIEIINNQICVRVGVGETFILNQNTDVAFLLKAAPRPASPGLKTSGKLNFQKNITFDEVEALRTWSEISEIKQYFSLSVIERRIYETRLGVYKGLDLKMRQQYAEAGKTLEQLFTKYKNGVSMETLYRGLSDVAKAPYDAMKSWKPGQTVSVGRGVSSWTTNYQTAVDFSLSVPGGRSVQFILKKGRTTTGELPIYAYSEWQDEMEVILNTNRFRVTKVVEHNVPRGWSDVAGKTKVTTYKQLEVHLEEVK